jgi:hypothetical protein
MRKRTEITIEFERHTIIRRIRGTGEKTLCPVCLEKTETLSADEAALIAKCSSRAIFGWCELGWLHFTETGEGLLLICSNSLGKIIRII